MSTRHAAKDVAEFKLGKRNLYSISFLQPRATFEILNTETRAAENRNGKRNLVDLEFNDVQY